MIECTVEEINNLEAIEDFLDQTKRNLMLARIYALTGCSMRSQKRLWKLFGESASIRLFDKMDELINAANNLFVLFDQMDAGETGIDPVSFEVYNRMMKEFVRSRNVWVKSYDKGLSNTKEEKVKQKCGRKPKGYVYGDFA